MAERDATFDALEGHGYIRLTTFRRSGEGVSTPVWFARAGGMLHVFTDAESGKVRRIRDNSRVVVEPSDFRGNPRGVGVEAVARIMDRAEFGSADRELREKYGWQYRLFHLALRLQGKSSRSTFLELRPVDGS